MPAKKAGKKAASPKCQAPEKKTQPKGKCCAKSKAKSNKESSAFALKSPLDENPKA